MITVDIETKAIEPFKPCLPEPVGIALRWENGNSQYLRWGHPSGNNFTLEAAMELVHEIWNYEWLTHNGLTFDVPVLQHWFDMPPRDPLLTHDTLFLAFLHNPHAESLALKDLAHDLCRMPPTEQRDLQDWILANTECTSRKRAGAYIAQAPGDLVAPYAIGDVERTWHLWNFLRGILPGMQAPYDRERLLAPILVDMQNTGVRIDRHALHDAWLDATQELEALDARVRDILQAPEINLDSDDDLVAKLQERGFSGFTKTNTGKASACKTSLDAALAADAGLRSALARRSELATLTRTFMYPWLDQSRDTGRIYPQYNQVRNPEGYGTRTGRLCVHADTPIVTICGELPISHLLPGTLVWTHEGRWRPIVDMFTKGDELMYTVYLSNGRSFRCTAAHRVLDYTGEWRHVDEYFASTSERPGVLREGCAGISKPGDAYNTATRFSDRLHLCNSSTDNSRAYTSGRVQVGQVASEIQIQDRVQEPHAREVFRAASQLQRCNLGRQGVYDAACASMVHRLEALCVSTRTSNVRGSWLNRLASWVGRSSRRQRPSEQPPRQSCSTDSLSAPEAACSMLGVYIVRVEKDAVATVYDIEVEGDHSYLACGVFHHNSSSSPNLQNVPPIMRHFVLPEEDHVWVTGDFKSQEPRLTAHFEDGALLRAFTDNPELDQYTWIAEMAGVTRPQAKTIFLGLLYGMGVVKLAAQLGIPESAASALRDKIRAALPDVTALNRSVMTRFKMGQSIRTLGGRNYLCEPSKNGNTFEYKAMNVLIQGSAADQAKEAMCYLHEHLPFGARIVGMVHDEISVSCPDSMVELVKDILREAASALPCDCPMLMSFGHGATWGDAK